jgi:AraC family transcriptional regulator of adaptative response/methylated-DNA-[protein]-cysteine methyltransferase
VLFFSSSRDAERAGFRPCKRCEPDRASSDRWRQKAVVRACRVIEESETPLSIKELSSRVGMSPCHFSRVFKKTTGVTPKEFAIGKRAERLRNGLGGGLPVTRAIFDAGYGSSSRFYGGDAGRLGMTPARYKSGGAGLVLRYALGKTSIGWLLVAAAETAGNGAAARAAREGGAGNPAAAQDAKPGERTGVCAVELDDEPEELLRRLSARFPNARLKKDENGLGEWVERLVSYIEVPRAALSLPLDLRGTAFQERVWRELRRIPPGATASYGEIARRIGAPKAARAVAGACASNPAAVAVPCHRAVRGDGEMGGYRWGLERKRALLAREAGENRRKKVENESG